MSENEKIRGVLRKMSRNKSFKSFKALSHVFDGPNDDKPVEIIEEVETNNQNSERKVKQE